MLHNHAPCAYQTRTDIQHDYGGYHSRSVLLLQRSLDGGRTWPAEQEVVVANEAAPLAEREQFLLSALTAPRAAIDLSKPGSIVVFPRTFLGPVRHEVPQMVSYALRSPDKGKTWEKVPFVLVPPPGTYSASPDNTPIVRLPDGDFLFPMRTFGGRDGVDLYALRRSGRVLAIPHATSASRTIIRRWFCSRAAACSATTIRSACATPTTAARPGAGGN